MLFLGVYLRLLRRTATAAMAMMTTTAATAIYTRVVGNSPGGIGAGEIEVGGVVVVDGGVEVGVETGVGVVTTGAGVGPTAMWVSAYDEKYELLPSNEATIV